MEVDELEQQMPDKALVEVEEAQGSKLEVRQIQRLAAWLPGEAWRTTAVLSKSDLATLE